MKGTKSSLGLYQRIVVRARCVAARTGDVRGILSEAARPPPPGSDVKRKAVMVAATGQHHGKTTVTLGMVQALLARNWNIAYQKPVGQQTVPVVCEKSGEELEIDRDVDIFKDMWPQLVGSYSDSSPVAFPPGFTRMVLDDKVQTTDLVKKCKESFERLLASSDYVVVEGTGHVGVGSIIDLNNAQVAAILGLDVVLVVPGGIGVSFDVLATNYALLKQHGVALKGVILNKVEPSKMEQNRIYYKKALDRWGVPLMGIIPSDIELPLLSMKSFAQILKGEFLCGQDKKLRFFHHTRLIVSPNDLVGDTTCDMSIQAHSLVILHTSRLDDMRAIVQQHLAHIAATGEDLAGGIVLFGPDVPSTEDIAALDAAGIPTLYIEKKDQDGKGFDLIRKVMNHTHKHHKDDVGRIIRTCDHINAHIDLDAVIA